MNQASFSSHSLTYIVFYFLVPCAFCNNIFCFHSETMTMLHLTVCLLWGGLGHGEGVWDCHIWRGGGERGSRNTLSRHPYTSCATYMWVGWVTCCWVARCGGHVVQWCVPSPPLAHWSGLQAQDVSCLHIADIKVPPLPHTFLPHTPHCLYNSHWVKQYNTLCCVFGGVVWGKGGCWGKPPNTNDQWNLNIKVATFRVLGALRKKSMSMSKF